MFPGKDELDKELKARGFRNYQEYSQLMAQVNLDLPDVRAGFKSWLQHDRSKAGLEGLIRTGGSHAR